MNNPSNLSGELKSPSDSLYLWKISNEPPFKYRILHKMIVMKTYNLIRGKKHDNIHFFEVYRIEAYLFQTLAIIIFYIFLCKMNMPRYALIGAFLFALLPPLLFAYNVPVHTREDTLAYLILILGLMAIIRNNFTLILLIAVAGVLCRETLLLIPFVNLFYNNKQNIYLRLFVAASAFSIFFLIRIYLGFEKYNYWEGFNWNIHNWEQILGFSFITFGILWVPFFLSFLPSNSHKKNNIIYQSSFAVFVLVMATTFLGGIFNEIRIIYLLSPWVMLISINHFEENRSNIMYYLKSKVFSMLAIISFGILIICIPLLIKSLNNFITPSQFNIPYTPWVIICAVQFYFAIVFIPYFYKFNTYSTK